MNKSTSTKDGIAHFLPFHGLKTHFLNINNSPCRTVLIIFGFFIVKKRGVFESQINFLGGRHYLFCSCYKKVLCGVRKLFHGAFLIFGPFFTWSRVLFHGRRNCSFLDVSYSLKRIFWASTNMEDFISHSWTLRSLEPRFLSINKSTPMEDGIAFFFKVNAFQNLKTRFWASYKSLSSEEGIACLWTLEYAFEHHKFTRVLQV